MQQNCYKSLCASIIVIKISMSRQFSTRGDDGLARLNVEALVRELETSMRARGGNYMNITGMNLAIVKTLMNYIDRLRDRIETLEVQIKTCPPASDVKKASADETPAKKIKTDPTTPTETDAKQEHLDNDDLARYEKLKFDLQKLYGGRAQEYDPTTGGYMFPPHGMCASDTTLKMIDAIQGLITKSEKDIARFEHELKKHPYTPMSPHPMIILQPGNPQNHDQAQKSMSLDTRNQLIRDIAKQEGERRILQEGLDFWRTVKPANAEYMQQIQRMFVEKKQLREKLWEVHNLHPAAW
jgi:hypothetical protein